MKLKKPEIFSMAEKGGERKLFKQILVFLLIFLISQILMALPAVIYEFVQIANGNLSPEEINEELMYTSGADSRIWLFLFLFGTILGSIYVIRRAMKKENRTLASFGFKGKTAFRDYIIGMVVGFVMFSLVVGINVVTGSMTIQVAANALNSLTIGYIIIFFIGFFFQGAFEEILLRGYFMVNIGAKYKTSTAIIVSSIMFALMHGANPGIGIVAVINLLLIAVFFALYMICFDNIWGICAIHSVWNFVQGCFYGIQVSGMEIVDTFFVCSAINGKELINGGAFGAEGGIATTIVCTIAITAILIYMKKKGKLEEKIVEKKVEEKAE